MIKHSAGKSKVESSVTLVNYEKSWRTGKIREDKIWATKCVVRWKIFHDAKWEKWMQTTGKMPKAILRNKNGSLRKEYATGKVILEVSKAFDEIVQNLLWGANAGIKQLLGLLFGEQWLDQGLTEWMPPKEQKPLVAWVKDVGWLWQGVHLHKLLLLCTGKRIIQQGKTKANAILPIW